MYNYTKIFLKYFLTHFKCTRTVFFVTVKCDFSISPRDVTYYYENLLFITFYYAFGAQWKIYLPTVSDSLNSEFVG